MTLPRNNSVSNKYIDKCKEGNIGAVYKLCELKKIDRFDKLVLMVFPTGGLSTLLFDVLADGFDAWEKEQKSL